MKDSKQHLPFIPYNWEGNLPVVMAIQALDRGEATPEQQKVVLDAIINDLAGYYDLSYRNTDRDTAFHEGRRFVGAQLVKLSKLNISRVSEISRKREAT